MKIQIQAGLFYITGKESELAAIKAVCLAMKTEMDKDLSIDDCSEGDKVTLECGYKADYYTIKEVKEMFQHAKRVV